MRATLIAMLGVAASVALAVAAARERPSYPDADPYYSEEFERLKACAAAQAPLYRYDYDHPEIASGIQISTWLRRTCGAEIEAVAKLVSPLEKTGWPGEMTGWLDEFVAAPFRPSEGPALRDVMAQASAGSSTLSENGRTSYMLAATGFAPGEMVAVNRSDAIDRPQNGFHLGWFHYSGRRDGWSYDYGGGDSSWTGRIARGNVEARVACYTLLGISGAANVDKACTIRIGRLLSLTAGGSRFQPAKICNPGEIETSDKLIRPHVRPSWPRAKARNGQLDIDGEVLPLPDGEACLPLDDKLVARLSRAKRLRSTFVGLFETRPAAEEGSGEVVPVALKFAEYLHRLTFDERAGSEMRANQETLYRRALPFTLQDALLAHDEWHGSVQCVARAALERGAATDGAIDAAMSDARCAAVLADLAWRAVSFKSEDAVPGDGADTAPGGPEKIAEARGLVRSEVARLLGLGFAPRARAEFAPGEAATSVMGHAGYSGQARTVRAKGYASTEPYAYAISGRRAWGVIPSTRFSSFREPQFAPQSMTITCEARRAPVCVIRVPTDDGGLAELSTNGTWNGAKLCLKHDGRDLAGWRLYLKRNAKADAFGELDSKGCLKQRNALLVRALIEEPPAPVLVEPGSDRFKAPEIEAMQEITFALALARFLAERVSE